MGSEHLFEEQVGVAVAGIALEPAPVRSDDRLYEDLQLGAVDGLDAKMLRELVSYVAARAAL